MAAAKAKGILPGRRSRLAPETPGCGWWRSRVPGKGSFDRSAEWTVGALHGFPDTVVTCSAFSRSAIFASDIPDSRIPESVREELISAESQDGLLTITVRGACSTTASHP